MGGTRSSGTKRYDQRYAYLRQIGAVPVHGELASPRGIFRGRHHVGTGDGPLDVSGRRDRMVVGAADATILWPRNPLDRRLLWQDVLANRQPQGA